MLVNVWDKRKRWLLHEFPRVLHISRAGSYRGRWNAKMCHRRFLRHLVWNQCMSTFNHVEFHFWLKSRKESMNFVILVLWNIKSQKSTQKIKKCSWKRVVRPRSYIGRFGLVIESVCCRYVQFDERRAAIMKWFSNRDNVYGAHVRKWRQVHMHSVRTCFMLDNNNFIENCKGLAITYDCVEDQFTCKFSAYYMITLSLS